MDQMSGSNNGLSLVIEVLSGYDGGSNSGNAECY